MKKFKALLNKKSGAELYIKGFQLCSILPIIYVFTVSGYPELLTKGSPLSFLFELGINSFTRAQALLLSLIYRKTASEVAVSFSILFFALFFGIAAEKLFKRFFKASRIAAAVIIFADIALRLIPISINTGFGKAAVIIGLLIRLLFLALIIYDLIYKKNNA